MQTKGTPEPTMTNIKFEKAKHPRRFIINSRTVNKQRLSLNKKTKIVEEIMQYPPRALLSSHHVSFLHVMRCKQKKTSTRINNKHYAIIY